MHCSHFRGNTFNSQVTMQSIGQAFNSRRIAAYVSGRRPAVRNVALLQMSRIASMNNQRENEILFCQFKSDSHTDNCGVNHVTRIIE
jgi:hypothetical protein